MTSHIDDLLPFYLNHTLSKDEIALVEAHLAVCPDCQVQIAEWTKLSMVVTQVAGGRLPAAMQQLGSSQAAFSPLVSASLKRRPPLQQAIPSAVGLILAQRVFLRRGWLASTLLSVILMGALTGFVLRYLASEWAVLPLLAAVPIAAALSTGFLYAFEDDPASEIISAAPTSMGTLIFARLTLALAAISLLAFLGSLLLVMFGRSAHSLFDLVAVWLGPMLLISALTTVVSLCLHPRVASAAALALWGSILIFLYAEQAGQPLLSISLLWLLHPGWLTLVLQVLLASIIWLFSWRWLAGNAQNFLQFDGGM